MEDQAQKNNTGQIPENDRPTVIDGRYRLDEIIGEGSYSIVFRGYDLDKHRRVAVKELKSQGMTKEDADEAHQLFFNEINVLKKLKHPNIPKVYDFIIFEGRHYMIMQWIKGKSLLTILEDGEKLTEGEALFYMEQVTSVLNYLQTRGGYIVYKDLKPSNILVNNSGHLWLIDFGTARFYSPEKKKDTHVLGTPGYAAPEAYTETQTDFSADVYSLGATFYHLTTGQEPFQFKFKFPDPKKFNKELSDEFSSLLLKCLKPREKRIQNAIEMNNKIKETVQWSKNSSGNNWFTKLCLFLGMGYFFFTINNSTEGCCGIVGMLVIFLIMYPVHKLIYNPRNLYKKKDEAINYTVFSLFSAMSIISYSQLLIYPEYRNFKFLNFIPIFIFPTYIIYRFLISLYNHFNWKFRKLYLVIFSIIALIIFIEIFLKKSFIGLLLGVFGSFPG